MNDLDRQLAELALINKTDLQLNPSLGSPGKKIGPAVPPKPKKAQPQIPQSYPLKQAVEPSYSSRLQAHQLYSNVQSNNSHSHYSNAQPQTLTNKYHSQRANDTNYANLPKNNDANQYANLPRSGSSVSRQGNYGSSEFIQKQGSLPRANMVPKGYDNTAYSNIQMAPARNQEGLIYSNLIHAPIDGSNIYSNLPPTNSSYANGDDLPPPPPPLDITSGLPDYAPCTVNTNLPPPPKELLPPPSPVSSSYSELRRATQPGQDFHNYSVGSQYGDSDSLYGFGELSQSSSTYESIYEPINPRPPSQMSSRSNYSLYAPYVSGGSSTAIGPSQSVSRLGHNKEQEVDNLTDLLVQGMRGGEESDIDQEDVYGICIKCGEKIIGENSGCTAMDQLYHIKCFTCHHCAINLQGKPFYALDGKPYCEEDYLNTLEKCCVCQKPILDRILRATGKPYHPRCFSCVVCGKSLDGIPFTVDATNRVHCIEDFHKIFAPRCWVCKQPIMPEPGEEETVRVVALDHSFHVQCYKCEDCGLVLSSEAEGRGCYPLDGHVLCKSCNAKRVQVLTNHMTTEL
ncbi:unnamed protein product [Phyllotreta striolata]|uniref:LIM zinc-binding domain-containing protein n=1 Tax=Phyllotreta striolata TaxID=444603 RepID=A0A9N9XLT6_PHYSR|nr:unnamed protein product [Phyllotreta striolata]